MSLKWWHFINGEMTNSMSLPSHTRTHTLNDYEMNWSSDVRKQIARIIHERWDSINFSVIVIASLFFLSFCCVAVLCCCALCCTKSISVKQTNSLYGESGSERETKKSRLELQTHHWYCMYKCKHSMKDWVDIERVYENQKSWIMHAFICSSSSSSYWPLCNIQ